MKWILAIDQSTSATKAILFDTKGNYVDSEAHDHKQIYPRPGWVEHDLDEIWGNAQKAISGLLGRHADKKNSIMCLSICNQRETVTVFEKGTGKHLYNALVWQCRRGHELCQELIDQGHGDYVREATGLRLDTYFSASKFKWIMEKAPLVSAQIKEGKALFGTIETYLIYQLTAGKTYVSDHSNACRTLLFNIKTLDWDPKLCALFNVPRAALPKIVESSDVVGTTDLFGLLDKPIPICGIMGDSQGSLFAQRCFKPGMAKVTLGSGSSILVNIGATYITPPEGSVATIGWVRNGKPVYCFEGIINYSAATISWLKNQVHMLESASESETLAQSVPDNGGVYLVPAFVGLGAPYWNSDAKAAIVGLSAHSTRAHIVRAALESIGYQIRDVIKMLEEGGCTFARICADGGPTANKFLMQFIANLITLNISAARIQNISPLGAALQGALGMNVYHTIDEIDELPFDSAQFSPEIDSEALAFLCDGWKKAVQRVLN